MIKYEYGHPASSNILIQLVAAHDLEEIENEAACIRQMAGDDFCLIALKVNDWNRDLSPWKAPAVFGKEDFGDGAAQTLAEVMAEVTDQKKTYYIGGYSLSGLFALWAAYQTNAFAGVAATSPSIWFPHFTAYMKTHEIKSEKVYLSLGDREERTRNPVMATVGNCIRDGYDWLQKKGVSCVLEWNQGNHFKDAGLRTAKAFAWLLQS